MATSNKKFVQSSLAAGLGLLVFVGCYNALVINSHSNIASVKNKRLDEIQGEVIPGRHVASWSKLSETTTKEIAQANYAQDQNSGSAEVISAAISSDLQLNLVEVTNPSKWPKGVNAGEFSGSLSTHNGAIELLNVSLPEGKNLNISFSEMTGNVFEYEFEGETLSGMIYQVDANSYLVNLGHGPFEGTRLKFQISNSILESEELVAQVQEQLADSHNIEVGSFGSNISAIAEVGMEFEADLNTQSFIF
jgi:hypothetical protein